MRLGRLNPVLMDRNNPTDDQLLLQLVFGLAKSLRNPREIECEAFVNAEHIPLKYVERLMRVIVERCQLPVPPERITEFIEHQPREVPA